MQVLRQAKPFAQVFDVLWHRPVRDCLHFLWIRSDAVDTDVASEDRDLSGTEDALLQVAIQLMLTHSCEDCTQMFKMNLQQCLPSLRTAVDENVVKVRRCKSTMGSHDILYQTIERRWCVHEPLWHHQPLPQHTAGCADGRQRHVTLTHQDLIESIHQIDRGEHLAPRHPVQQHIFPWDGGLSWDRVCVQLIESVHHAPTTCGFTHTERRTGVRRLRLTH